MANMTRHKVLRALGQEHLNACGSSMRWIESHPGDPSHLWSICHNPGWMLWLIAQTNPRKFLIKVVVACLRKIMPNQQENAVFLLEEWSRGHAADDLLERAVLSKTDLLKTAPGVAREAHYAAAWGVDSALAPSATYAGRYAASSVLAAAEYRSGSQYNDTYRQILRETCDTIRELVSWDDVEKGL